MLEEARSDELLRDANPVTARRSEAEVNAALMRVQRILPPAAQESAAREAASGIRLWLFGSRAVAMLSVGGSALIALLVAGVVLLSSSPSSAFAGWSATPSRAGASSTAAAREACGNVAARSMLAADARGPYTAIVYTRGGSPWQCVTEGTQVFLNQSTEYPPSVVINPAAGKVTRPMISRTVTAPAKARVNALEKRDIELDKKYARFVNSGYPRAFLHQDDKLQEEIFAIETGPSSLTAVSGSIGSGVTGVTFVLGDGRNVRATVGHGWYLAWWPGSSRVSTPDPASILVTTTHGAKRVAYDSSSLRRFYGPCLVNACAGPGGLAVRAGFAENLERSFALFSNRNPTPVRDVAAIDLTGFQAFAARVFGLDESQMREVSYGRTGSILVIPGNEGMCVLRTYPPAIDIGGNGGGCSHLSNALGQGVIVIADGSTLEGVIPNGNKTVTAHFAAGRTVTVPVKDNTVLAVFNTAPKDVTYRTSSGKPIRWQ